MTHPYHDCNTETTQFCGFFLQSFQMQNRLIPLTAEPSPGQAHTVCHQETFAKPFPLMPKGELNGGLDQPAGTPVALPLWIPAYAGMTVVLRRFPSRERGDGISRFREANGARPPLPSSFQGEIQRGRAGMHDADATTTKHSLRLRRQTKPHRLPLPDRTTHPPIHLILRLPKLRPKPRRREPLPSRR